MTGYRLMSLREIPTASARRAERAARAAYGDRAAALAEELTYMPGGTCHHSLSYRSHGERK